MFKSTPPVEPTRRQLLQGIAAFSASAFLAGCNSSKMVTTSPVTTQPAANAQPMPSGPLTTSFLSVAASSAGSIGSGFAGLSYEKSMMTTPLFSGSNTNLIGMFQLLGPSVLRIGGNTVDQYLWTPNGTGQKTWHIAPSDIDALAAFLKATGWQCIYGINLGAASRGATTPSMAADEVAYVSKQLGSALIGIEIGNECDGYGAPGSYYAGNWSLAQFQTQWGQFRDAIVAATPGVSIVGPASGSNVSGWTVPFAKSVTRNGLSMVTQHYYRGDGQTANLTTANLISADSNLPKCMGALSAASQSTGIPFRIGECNSYFNGGAMGVSNSYASALWVLDFLFGCAQGGASGVNFHGGGHANGYTPIADNNGAVVEARPEFYGITMFTMAGQGTLCGTSLSSGSANATAYAVKSASGGMNIIIVNKDATQNLDLSISLPQSARSASLLTMSQLSSGANGPSLSATSGVTIQGAAITASGDLKPASPYALTVKGTQVDCYVPALSAVLIQVN